MTDVLVPPSRPPAEVAAKAAVLRRLELDVTRRLDGLLTGDHRGVTSGPGTEPSGARPYGPGDDARRIDWNLTARALETHVRTTEADRELETWIVADRSASLDFGTAVHEKRELVLAGLAAFGFLGVRAGNRVGVMIAGGARVVRLPAVSGRHSLLASMSRVYDTPRQGAGPTDATDLTAALAQLERTQVRRGRVVVLSDFLDVTDWSGRLARLNLRHEVIAAHITDPRELTLPPVGMLSVVDPETGRSLHVQTNSRRLRERFAAAAGARHAAIRHSITQSGAAYLHLSTDRDWLIDVVRFVGRRRFEHPAGASRR